MDEPDQEAYRQLTAQLKAVDRGLTYEMGRGETWEIIVSADGAPELVPAVQAVVAQALKVSGWKVVAFRQPSPEPPVITVFEEELTAENVFFVVESTREGTSDLVLYLPGIEDFNYRHMAHCAMLMMESLIGELAVMTTIGEIEYESTEEMPPEAQPLSMLPLSI